MPPAARARKASRDLAVEEEPVAVVPAAPAADDKQDLAKMLRDMEEENAREVQKVTTDRSAVEKSEKEAREALDLLKIEEAAKEVAALEREAATEAEATSGGSPPPDRLMKVRARRRSRDLTDEAKDLLGAQLAGAFKALDINGDGTLDHSEVQKAFADSGQSVFTDDSFKPILEELLEQHGGAINFEQFKDLAWKGNLAASLRTAS
tara:strand:- start:113 stop:733 length:621 start_codon:yes stop_codon:yes gene_type:complete